MNRGKPVALGLAIIIMALITSLLAYKWLRNRAIPGNTAQAVEQAEVAVTDLSPGAVIADGDIKRVSFFKNTLAEGYFSDPSLLHGRGR